MNLRWNILKINFNVGVLHATVLNDMKSYCGITAARLEPRQNSKSGETFATNINSALIYLVLDLSLLACVSGKFETGVF